MKGRSVLRHVTDWNDAMDEERAPKSEQKSRVCQSIAAFKARIEARSAEKRRPSKYK